MEKGAERERERESWMGRGNGERVDWRFPKLSLTFFVLNLN